MIQSAGGHPIRTTLDWEAALLEARVGQPLRVAVGEGVEPDRVVSLVPADLPSLAAERVSALEDFELITLTPAIRSERGLAREQGALIVGLSDVARRLGLREGDLIIAINRYAVTSAEEAASLLDRLQQVPGRVGVRLLVEREGREFYAGFYL